jgi:hypothetical protein
LINRNPALIRWALTFLTLVFVAVLIQPVFASPEFSGQTRQACSACHISGTGDRPPSHDVGRRLSWELQAPLSVRPQETDWQAARNRMEAGCLQCHSHSWTISHFTGLDRVVSEYNQRYYQPIVRKLEALHLYFIQIRR